MREGEGRIIFGPPDTVWADLKVFSFERLTGLKRVCKLLGSAGKPAVLLTRLF